MTSALDWFLRGVSRGSERFDRPRVLVLGAFAAAATSFGFVFHRLYLEPEIWAGHANVALATIVMACTPFVLKLTGSYRAAAHLMLTGLTVLVSVDAWLYGGIGSQSVYVLFVVPLMASFFLGRATGVAYAVFQALALAVLFGLTETGNVLPAPEDQLWDRMRLVGAIGVLGFVAMFSAIYEGERTAAVARAAAIVDHLADGVISLDREARVRFANARAAELLGVATLDLDVSISTFLDGALDALVLQAIRTRALAETQIPLGDGRIARVLATPVLVGEGVPDGVIVILRDVTLEREVDKMKTEFIATVSHELRTPMTSVLGFAKVIGSQLDRKVRPALPEDPSVERAMAKVDRNLGIIVSEGERLTALINDLLDIAKMESGRMEWNRGPVDPAELAQRALDATQGLFDGGQVELVGDIGPDLPGLEGDGNRLLQVLINLISNAAKFTTTGAVTLAVAAVPGGVRFEVRDTGPGIPTEALARIFDRFRQADESKDVGHRGTGLGLAIAREIVVAHNGSIDVTSTLGEGSTFSVALPVD